MVRALLGVFAASLLGLMAIDQHRLQPWAYQSLIIAILLGPTWWLARKHPGSRRGAPCSASLPKQR